MKCDFYSNEPLWTFYDPNIEIRYDLGLVDRVSAGFTLGHVDKYFSDTSETGVGWTLISIRVYKLSPRRFYCFESSPNQPNSFPYNSIQDFLRLP